MKFKINKKQWFALTVLLLLGVVAYLCTMLRRAENQIDSLNKNIVSLNNSKEDVYVTERISKQMEDIAYQQKAISDNQREEAKKQTDIAMEMRLRAELEQLNAQQAATEADKARLVAEDQRSVAEKQTEEARYQQHVAELARSKADTLSHILLGRSLAINSNRFYTSGNKDVANYLIYAAYYYLTQYGVSPYSSTMYSYLVKNSETLKPYHIHQGGVSRIVSCPETTGSFISVSKMGEIIKWNLAGEKIKSPIVLMKDKNYSFRDACAVGNKIYALAFDGTLVGVEGNRITSSMQLEADKKRGFLRLTTIGQNGLAALTANNMYVINVRHNNIEHVEPIPDGLLAASDLPGITYIYTKAGQMMKISDDGLLKSVDFDYHDNTITAIAFDSKYNTWALGTSDGQVVILNGKGRVLRRKNVHNSKITRLDFYNSFLITSSMDRTINMIDLVDKDQEIISLCSMSSWIYDFNVNSNGYLLIADDGGNVSYVLTNPVQLSATIKNRIKRDLTPEEWKTYIGANVPYAKLVYPNK